MRLGIKGHWVGATRGFGKDNRRARRIERARLERQARREANDQIDPPGPRPFTRCLTCGERFCDGC